MKSNKSSNYKVIQLRAQRFALLSISSICILLCSGCFSMDPFLFSGKPLPKYQFDSYSGRRECGIALDTIKTREASGLSPVVTDSCIREYSIASGDGTFSAVLLSKKPPSFTTNDTMIVFFRGTGAHIDFYWPRTRLLYATGYPAMILDYRGFGQSEGIASEATISQDGNALMRFIQDSLGNPKVIVYSYSLGSLVGCDVLASNSYSQVIGLILESPIGSIQTIVEDASFLNLPGSYLTTYTGNNAERIKSIHVPLLWIHGTQDETTNYETQGLPIWNNFTGKGYYIKSSGALHANNPIVIGYTRYINIVQSFCNGTIENNIDGILSGNSDLSWGKK